MMECPACGGPAVHLGALGRVNHFRCRDCGALTHADAEPCAYCTDPAIGVDAEGELTCGDDTCAPVIETEETEP